MLQQKPRKNLVFEKHLKCGEIYFLADDLTFFCVVCDLDVKNFLEFQNHFENEHRKHFAQKNNEEDYKIREEAQNYDSEDDPLSWIAEKRAIKTHAEDLTKNVKVPLTDDEAAANVDYAEKEQKEFLLARSSNNIEDSDTKSNNSSLADCTPAMANIDWSKPFQPAQQIVKRSYKPRDKPNSCNYCGRTFRRRSQLDTHLNIHTGEKPHQCDICGRRFRALTTLQRHLNTHRSKQKLHHCQFCEKSFTHRAALLSHESRHNQTRNVACDECEKKFYTMNQCDTHRRRVHKKSNIALPNLPFGCDICSNRYRSASMLSTHKLRKHLKSAKFTCEKCDKRFVDAEKHDVHQRIHHINKIV